MNEIILNFMLIKSFKSRTIQLTRARADKQTTWSMTETSVFFSPPPPLSAKKKHSQRIGLKEGDVSITTQLAAYSATWTNVQRHRTASFFRTRKTRPSISFGSREKVKWMGPKSPRRFAVPNILYDPSRDFVWAADWLWKTSPPGGTRKPKNSDGHVTWCHATSWINCHVTLSLWTCIRVPPVGLERDWPLVTWLVSWKFSKNVKPWNVDALRETK